MGIGIIYIWDQGMLEDICIDRYESYTGIVLAWNPCWDINERKTEELSFAPSSRQPFLNFGRTKITERPQELTQIMCEVCVFTVFSSSAKWNEISFVETS